MSSTSIIAFRSRRRTMGSRTAVLVFVSVVWNTGVSRACDPLEAITPDLAPLMARMATAPECSTTSLGSRTHSLLALEPRAGIYRVTRLRTFGASGQPITDYRIAEFQAGDAENHRWSFHVIEPAEFQGIAVLATLDSVGDARREVLRIRVRPGLGSNFIDVSAQYFDDYVLLSDLTYFDILELLPATSPEFGDSSIEAACIRLGTTARGVVSTPGPFVAGRRMARIKVFRDLRSGHTSVVSLVAAGVDRALPHELFDPVRTDAALASYPLPP